ncbi:tetratricopeptide repeat protein [Actinoplanes sp. NPDC024001]|uniref:ATP-binding protein n=1 Tax=Actinoplanes sp. NPDC024001 TaxID=3154598 RepID=UPI0033F310F8
MIGQHMRVHRGRLGLTQEELAECSGVSVRSIRDLEAGRVARPRRATVELLAEVFGVPPEELLDTGPIPGSGWPRPAQLPAAPAGFAGRADIVVRLDASTRLAVVSGTAGVGKTAIALHWGHRVADRFPDGQLYVNLNGFGPSGRPVEPATALRGFLEALGVAAQRMPADLDGLAALYRSLLAGRRVLTVLDNARDAEQVRPLLPAAAACRTVVTSRDALVGLCASDGADLIALSPLSDDEATALLAHRLGDRRLAAEPAAVRDIVHRCVRLPLPLTVIAARAVSRPGLRLTELAGELGDSRRRLDLIDAGDPATDLRSIFSWSYRALSPAAARLFRLLGQHPGPDIGTAAASALAGDDARGPLAELTAAHLIVEDRPGRYGFHDLLRAYAQELPDPDAATAVSRMLDHYLHTAYRAATLLDPERDRITLPPPAPGARPETLADTETARIWFAAETPTLLATLRACAQQDLPRYVWQLAWCVSDVLRRAGRWTEQFQAQEAGLRAATEVGDDDAQARMHRNLGRLHIRLRRFDEADQHFTAALAVHERHGDRVGAAHSRLQLSDVNSKRGRHREALGHARQAMADYQAAGRHGWAGDALDVIGWEHALLGEYRETLTHCTRALELQQQAGDRYGQASTWHSLGYAHRHLGDHPAAITCLRTSVELYEEFGDLYNQARGLRELGEAHRAAGDEEAARKAWEEALTILTELAPAEADELRRLATRP